MALPYIRYIPVTCVGAYVEGMIFRHINLGWGIEHDRNQTRQFWSRIGYDLPEKWPVYKYFSLRTGPFTCCSVMKIENRRLCGVC